MKKITRRAVLRSAVSVAIAAPVAVAAVEGVADDTGAADSVEIEEPPDDSVCVPASGDGIVKEFVGRRFYTVGYEVRREMWLLAGEDKSTATLMRAAYTPSGDYLGDAKMARYLYVKRGIRFCETRTAQSSVCSIGFQPQERKWYGWSHRAIAGFAIGDRLFVEDYGDEDTLFTQHGPTAIATLADAKLAASRFAASVG